ncbi:hypothetical protein [Sulfurospirillum sp. MES]|uniref:hypothetical protein n=1 Tax=Sulfurospirillum sp. MES TaxID=1565314 RepID=UPI0005440E30|nr:hypothetical protein [Sulfurospirillum sp. MES]KHG32987.1 MAG: hypothetical protein OA34_12370 [Sulfurospirillum sp. MES]
MGAPYAIVQAENALNRMIDRAMAPGTDLWQVELQKKAFLTSLQEAITQEVEVQTSKMRDEIRAAQQHTQASLSLQNNALSYEKIERYNMRQAREPGFSTLMHSFFVLAPRSFATGALIALAGYGVINLFIRF